MSIEQRAKIGVANYFKDFSAVLAKTFGWWEKIHKLLSNRGIFIVISMTVRGEFGTVTKESLHLN
jgi:hypothetical protein